MKRLSLPLPIIIYNLFVNINLILLDKCFEEETIFEVKGSQGGRPLVITSIIKPEKEIKTPAESIRRKHTHAIKHIVESQVPHWGAIYWENGNR